MPYGILKADTLTYYTATGDVSIAISGLAISGSPLISGVSGIFTTSVSGATVTGDAGQFTTITGGTAQFTNITGVSGTFTSRISGATVTGTSGQFTTLTATTGVFTSVSGGTVSGDVGLFNTISGNQGVFNSSLSVPSGTAASPSISFNGDPNTGIYSSGADAVAISTNGTGRITIDGSGNVNIDSNTLYVDATNNRVGIGTSAPDAQLSVVGVNNGLIAKFGGNSAVYSRALQINEFAVSGTNNVGFQINSPGSGSQAALSLATQGVNRVYIDNVGNVGIGTTSVTALLQIGSTPAATGGSGPTAFAIQRNNSTATLLSMGPHEAAQTSAAPGAVICSNNRGMIISNISPDLSSGEGIFFDLTGSSVRLHAGDSERVRIDSSGRLLVGTSTARSNFFNTASSAPQQLQVEGTTGNTCSLSSICSVADTSGGRLLLAHQRSGAVGGNTILNSGDQAGYITFQGNDGGEFVECASIEAVVDGTPGANDMPGRLVFSTTADGASSPTERVRISQNGVVTVKNGAVAEIGTLADGATVTPDFAANCNFTLTISGNRTLANPTNITAGQTGSIFIIQGTGSNALSWGSYWDFTGGTAPTLSTASGAVDRVDYVVRTSTSIHTVFTANYS